MTKITAGPEVIAALRKAKEEGKTMTRLGEELLAEAEAAEGKPTGRTKLVAALYLLGGSLSQIAAATEIKPGTVWTYVRAYIPQKLRQRAGAERDFGRKGPLVESYKLKEYIAEWASRRGEMRGWDAVKIAAELARAVGVGVEEAKDEAGEALT